MDVVASAAQKAINGRKTISTADDLESVHENLISNDWQTTSANFEPVAEQVKVAQMQVEGDFEIDSHFSKEPTTLQSFIVRSQEGDVLQVVQDKDTNTTHRHELNDTTSHGSITINLFADTILYSIYLVDQYIDENGLRPVVDEIKERRWVILVSYALLGTYCQIGSC